MGQKHNWRKALIRLNITSEGFSEERFVTDILRPHLLDFNVYVETRKVLTNRKLKKRGGIVGYIKFKNNITQWFNECPDVYHTTLIDLYGLKNNFPGYISTKTLQPYNRIIEMENQLKDDLNFYKFIPYIQLHEYEALMYSDTKKWKIGLVYITNYPINALQRLKILSRIKIQN